MAVFLSVSACLHFTHTSSETRTTIYKYPDHLPWGSLSSCSETFDQVNNELGLLSFMFEYRCFLWRNKNVNPVDVTRRPFGGYSATMNKFCRPGKWRETAVKLFLSRRTTASSPARSWASKAPPILYKDPRPFCRTQPNCQRRWVTSWTWVFCPMNSARRMHQVSHHRPWRGRGLCGVTGSRAEGSKTKRPVTVFESRWSSREPDGSSGCVAGQRHLSWLQFPEIHSGTCWSLAEVLAVFSRNGSLPLLSHDPHDPNDTHDPCDREVRNHPTAAVGH